MSHRPLPRGLVGDAAHMSLDIARLDRLVEHIPHDLLANQRWFRSKSRVIADLSLDEAAPLVVDPRVSDAVLLIVRVRFADDGADELYLLPMLSEPDAPGPSPAKQWGIVAVRDAATGTVLREPRDGDGVWRRLLAGIDQEITLPGLHGSFAFHALQPIPAAANERRMTGEQSNTSIALGDELLLKLYRRLEGGENPDLELPRFLTRAGFDRVPAVLGYVRYIPVDGEPSAVAMLQAFLPDAVDAWRWLLDALSAGDDALLEIGRLGTVTAEMHRALAWHPQDLAFPARPAAAQDRVEWRRSAEHQVELAVAAAPELDRLRSAIRDAFDAFERSSESTVSRIHGDYHLGQLLRSRNEFWVIDFEGEPARALADRRRPGSPLRDVAGMLRSLDYAARTVERSEDASGFAADAWLREAREAFLRAYRSAGMAVDEQLLRAFELEKACYEVHYEANNRPDWTWLPLRALERLAHS
jgi:maltokinase